MYLDNMVAGGPKSREAVPSLGEGLPLLEDGSLDSGVRQDLFHLLDRIFSTIPGHAGMLKLKG